MAKNRNHYFKVKPGDDARAFAEIDIETEGFIARLRRTAHDREPYGFLVDLQRRPYNEKRIADIVRLTNNRTGIVLAEAHAARLIESAAQFRSALAEASNGGKRARAKLQCFDAMCRELPADVPLGSVYLMPTLVDDFIDSEVGKNSGKLGGNPELVRFTQGLTTALTPTLTPQDKAQISESKSESESKAGSESTSSPTRERESSAAHARGDQDKKPMPWNVYGARCHDVSVWLAKQPEKQSPEAFDAGFAARFQMSWAAWNEIKRQMDEAIPQPCHDGFHVFEGGNECLYCGVLRVGESA